MHKIMLLLILLSISNVATSREPNRPTERPFVNSITDTGTNTRPNITIAWHTFYDAPDSGNIKLNCSSGVSSCYYGLYIKYRKTWDSSEMVQCGNGDCQVVSSKSSTITLRQLREQWIKEYGSTGSYNTGYWNYRPYRWDICFGFQPIFGSSVPLQYTDCQVVPETPVNCEVNNDTLELQHGTLSSTELSSVNPKKSITKSFTISCSRAVSARFDLLQSEIDLTDGLKSTLTMKYNGVDIRSGGLRTISDGNISITSTLSAVGNIPPDIYSGSTALIINLL